MTIANWCVVAACLLPVLTVGMAKSSRFKLSRKNGGYDNHHPREWAAKLDGWQARAVAAQNNGFESLPLFIATVILAQQAHATQSTIDALAISFIAIRIVYIFLYIKDYPWMRSVVWFLGVVACIAMLLID
jgi:uncharacterized MAPEG superfamily protein